MDTLTAQFPASTSSFQPESYEGPVASTSGFPSPLSLSLSPTSTPAQWVTSPSPASGRIGAARRGSADHTETLAVRRMLKSQQQAAAAATSAGGNAGGARPPMTRRRSKSLDELPSSADGERGYLGSRRESVESEIPSEVMTPSLVDDWSRRTSLAEDEGNAPRMSEDDGPCTPPPDDVLANESDYLLRHHHPVIKPIDPPSPSTGLKLSQSSLLSSESHLSSPLTPNTASSSSTLSAVSSTFSSRTFTSTATAGSSILPYSPISPPPDCRSPLSIPHNAGRRTSDPPPLVKSTPLWSPLVGTGGGVARSISEQGPSTPAWSNLGGDTVSPKSLALGATTSGNPEREEEGFARVLGGTVPQAPSLGARTISDTGSTVSSRTTTGPTTATVQEQQQGRGQGQTPALGGGTARFAAAVAALDMYSPALPSPLSNVHTPDTLAEEEDDSDEMGAVGGWRLPTSLGERRTSGSRRGGGGGGAVRGEFPFPPSPSNAGFGAAITSTPSSHSAFSRAAEGSPSAAPPSPRQRSSPISQQQPFTSPPPRSDPRQRCQSGYASFSSPFIDQVSSAGPPQASTHWRAASTTTAATPSASSRHSRTPSHSSNGSILTPPESYPTSISARQSMGSSASDLAWSEVGRIGGPKLGSPFAGGPTGGSNHQHLLDVAALAKVATVATTAAGGADPSITMDFMGFRAGTGTGTDPSTPRRPLLPATSVGNFNSPRSGTPMTGESAKQRVGNEDLMGGVGAGHFGPATREKLSVVLKNFLGDVPLPEGEGTVHIVEYGALNSRSSSLVPSIITQIVSRQDANRKANNMPLTADDCASFQVTHADKPSSDFRSLAQHLETDTDSYLNQHWQSKIRPISLDNRIFSSFTARPFGAKVLPKASVSVGFSAMSLHWLSTDRKYRMSPATIAHGELMAFLSARAVEFKTGGLLALAYIARSEDELSPSNSSSKSGLSRSVHPGLNKTHSDDTTTTRSSPVSPAGEVGPTSALLDARPLLRERSTSSPTIPVTRKRDIWSILSSILGKAIQRLVSTNLLKPAVARKLLALPIHPRTEKQTQAVLKAVGHAWTVESSEQIVISHPAWRGMEHNTVSQASYTEHTIQLLKIFWESEMRSILREALLSRAACEFILENLFDIAREKVEEEGAQPLDLEVQIVALRRRATDA
ncbi:hypothetical protein T439DRAFT_358144 [Meredithblackwellia eburnea MCA 4105]